MGLDDVGGFLMGLATGTLMGGALGFMFLQGAGRPAVYEVYPSSGADEDDMNYWRSRSRHQGGYGQGATRRGEREMKRYVYNPARPYASPQGVGTIATAAKTRGQSTKPVGRTVSMQGLMPGNK